MEISMKNLEKSTAGERILTLQQEQIMAGVQAAAPGKKRLFLRVYSRLATKREAIKAKCLDCSNLSADEVRRCPATGCPLHAYRPFQK